jgi:hypothetical protein
MMWEVCPAAKGGEIFGYQVRWSEPNEQGRYLMVGHYFAGDNSLAWCENAAQRDAQHKNESGKCPWEYHGFRPKEMK